jgi:hypothetical protein
MTNQPLQAIEQDESLTPDEHLEAVLFQFVTLYERWSEDRQVSAKQSADTSKFIKEFAQHVGQFAKLEEKVRNDIKTSIRTEAENTAVYFSKTIGEAARKEVEPTISKLSNAVGESENVLNRYRSSLRFANWEMVTVSIVSSLLLNLIIIWWLMPHPTLPLTSQQTRYLITGESFTEIWPKLTKAEKERFKKLAGENGMIIHG